MSLLLAFQSSDVTGSGASSLVFTDTGIALEVFAGAGASSLVLADAGSALEVFAATGASSLTVADVGAALETFLGVGATDIVLADTGAGTVEGGAPPEPPPSGGGWTWRDQDRRRTVKAFQRLLQPKVPERRQRPAVRRPDEIFAYVSESSFAVMGSSGRGSVSLVRGAGASRAMVQCRGRGRIEESAADIIRLLLSLDEI